MSCHFDRRQILSMAGLAAAQQVLTSQPHAGRSAGKRVVLVTLGGIRRAESFSESGIAYVPHLFHDLLPHALFYPYVLNEGVTAHVNTIASILTGVWQRLDDWGRQETGEPTLFKYLQKQRRMSSADTWVVTSNKAVTRKIGAGANVVLAKQLMIEAVERIILGYSSRDRLEREAVLAEMETVMLGEHERVGWSLPSYSASVREALVAGLTTFIRGPGYSTDGDELTFVMAREILQRVAPALMVMNFSGMEIAHSGAYSLHIAGIRNVDSLCYRLWQYLQSNNDYAGRTTLVVMPEFGRDPDGSSTNGFFNHRSDTNSCRLSWMMVLGQAVRKPAVVERVIRHIDVAPSLGALLGVACNQAMGRQLAEFAI